MIISVAVQAYLTRIGNLLLAQGFKGVFNDPNVAEATLRNMRVIYDAESSMTEEWLSDELASTKMARKGTTTKATVRSEPFMALFWKRSPLEPLVRQPFRVLDTPEDPSVTGVLGKSTVSASFTIACVFVSNKAEAIEDLEEAFASVFQSSYNMPLSLQYIYNSSEAAAKAPINFTLIQNMGESDLVNFKEGNLFAYSWSAKIFMNYVSEFTWSKVHPVDEVVIDLYGPGGLPLASLDAAGIAHTHAYTADSGETVPNVPDEPLIAFTRADPRDYALFAITSPFGVSSAFPLEAAKISPEARALIEGAVVGIGGEMSLRGTEYMVIARMPLSLNHVDGNDHAEDVLATSSAVSEAIRKATGDAYVVTPMPDADAEQA